MEICTIFYPLLVEESTYISLLDTDGPMPILRRKSELGQGHSLAVGRGAWDPWEEVGAVCPGLQG